MPNIFTLNVIRTQYLHVRGNCEGIFIRYAPIGEVLSYSYNKVQKISDPQYICIDAS